MLAHLFFDEPDVASYHYDFQSALAKIRGISLSYTIYFYFHYNSYHHSPIKISHDIWFYGELEVY